MAQTTVPDNSMVSISGKGLVTVLRKDGDQYICQPHNGSPIRVNAAIVEAAYNHAKITPHNPVAK